MMAALFLLFGFLFCRSRLLAERDDLADVILTDLLVLLLGLNERLFDKEKVFLLLDGKFIIGWFFLQC
jgi:hypothetical protein